MRGEKECLVVYLGDEGATDEGLDGGGDVEVLLEYDGLSDVGDEEAERQEYALGDIEILRCADLEVLDDLQLRNTRNVSICANVV